MQIDLVVIAVIMAVASAWLGYAIRGVVILLAVACCLVGTFAAFVSGLAFGSSGAGGNTLIFILVLFVLSIFAQIAGKICRDFQWNAPRRI